MFFIFAARICANVFFIIIQFRKVQVSEKAEIGFRLKPHCGTFQLIRYFTQHKSMSAMLNMLLVVRRIQTVLFLLWATKI